MSPTSKWREREWWLTILTAVAGIGTAVAGILPADKAVIVMAVVAAAYSLSRGLAKVGAPPPMVGPVAGEVGAPSGLPPARMGGS